MKVTTEACLFGAWAAEQLKMGTPPENMLDIGAGTGLLSLMVAQQHHTHITGIELDHAAAVQCSANFTISPWAERLTLTEGDVRIFPLKKTFDGVISNPPFYENELVSPVKGRQLAHHSAELSLKELLQRVQTLLNETGKFMVLLPWKRRDELFSLAGDNHLHILHQCSVRNSPKHPWFRLMAVLSLNNTSRLTEESISIRDEQNNYSAEFIRLLQPYYLNL